MFWYVDFVLKSNPGSAGFKGRHWKETENDKCSVWDQTAGGGWCTLHKNEWKNHEFGRLSQRGLYTVLPIFLSVRHQFLFYY